MNDFIQEPDTKEGNYYVSVVDGNKKGFLLGPFENDHKAALNMVEQVKVKAQEIDPRAVFYGFGTARVDKTVYNHPGILNHLFGM
jgi:hypothetical protein